MTELVPAQGTVVSVDESLEAPIIKITKRAFGDATKGAFGGPGNRRERRAAEARERRS